MPKRSRVIGEKEEGQNSDPVDDMEDRKPAVAVRSGSNKNNNDHVDCDSSKGEFIDRVTPHMERLLRLIEEGTTDSAQLAAGQLTNLTSRSSALVLWEVLGRLQSMLQSLNSWKARQNAAMAMEGVAGNLPIADQRGFFQNTHSELRQTSPSSLRIAEISAEAVLNQGQELFACAPSKYEERMDDSRENELTNLDQNSADFVQERIKRQRRILAERLGLAVIDAALQNQGKQDREWDKIVSNEDINSTYQSSRGRKRRRRDENEKVTGIQLLLVHEMTKANQASGAASHREPQHLLANELIYRMFDNVWQKRHGALLGILALLKAWRKTVWESFSEGDEGTIFGPWPEDILARSMCLLSLDRFGDFSGATTDTVSSNAVESRAKSGAVVAPVREMGAQLVSMLWRMAPVTLQQEALDFLKCLLEKTEDWECQHGILLALKYITVVVVADREKYVLGEKKRIWFVECIDTCGKEAGRFLGRSNQEVVAVAAQILCECPAMVLEDRSMLQNMWKILRSLDVLSSSVNDIITLLSRCVQSNAEKCLSELAKFCLAPVSEEIFSTVCRFLESPLMSVRRTALRSLDFLARVEVIPAYSQIMKRLFKFYIALTDEQTLLGDDSGDEMDLIFEQLDRTWISFCNLGAVYAVKLESDVKRVLIDIFEIYFNADETISRPRLYHLLMGSSCAAVSTFVTSFLNYSAIHRVLICSCMVYLDSPWIQQCELACALLIRVSASEELAEILQVFVPIINRIVEGYATCLRFIDCSGELILDHSLKRKHTTDFLSKLENDTFDLGDLEGFFQDATQSVDSKNQTKKFLTSLENMRLRASGASSAIRLGIPSKVTPCIRALMTSMNSEASSFRLNRTACALIHFLHNSHDDARLDGARAKILTSLSDIIVGQKSKHSLRATYASKAIGSYLSRLSREILPMTVYNLKSLGTLQRFLNNPIIVSPEETDHMLTMMESLIQNLETPVSMEFFVNNYMKPLCILSCREDELETVRHRSRRCILYLCDKTGSRDALDTSFLFAAELIDREWAECDVLNGCLLLKTICELPPSYIGRFVKMLLPVVLKAMTNHDRSTSSIASGVFAVLVRVAPLIDHDSCDDLQHSHGTDSHASLVIDHLVRGKPLPCKPLPPEISSSLDEAGVTLRDYQLEGISWISFLMSVNLNGALCDSMGLGKSVQALVGIALGHQKTAASLNPKSIVVCPATIVNHWIDEVRRFFPGENVFRPFAVVGDSPTRRSFWSNFRKDTMYNLIVVSYGTLRTDIDFIERTKWVFCVLDEGHVLRNPNTTTARASRKVTSRYRMLLSGTMIQNKVHDVWATFDFLMPNFLGSSREFAENFARPITKSQLPSADAECISKGMEKLKLLHQQVLPFILRREKEQVLKELPAKNITILRIPLSFEQQRLYDAFSSTPEAKESMSLFEASCHSGNTKAGSKVLRILLFLRLICTHPSLIDSRREGPIPAQTSYGLSSSGKFLTLYNLLRDCGVSGDGFMAGDDEYCVINDELPDARTDSEATLQVDDTPLNTTSSLGNQVNQSPKCLVFAQYAQTLDAIEKYLFVPHMPSLRYLRLDGNVPPEHRVDVANRFNADPSISVLLLTTRVGSLGLNLTGASIVIFIEHDFNPFVDEQAMDRVHRIGQRSNSINIYRLIAADSIDEKIMDVQRKKVAMSKAVVNTDNSNLYSLGTDRLLDIFTPTEQNGDDTQDLDAILTKYAGDYESLSVDEFIRKFELHSSK